MPDTRFDKVLGEIPTMMICDYLLRKRPQVAEIKMLSYQGGTTPPPDAMEFLLVPEVKPVGQDLYPGYPLEEVAKFDVESDRVKEENKLIQEAHDDVQPNAGTTVYESALVETPDGPVRTERQYTQPNKVPPAHKPEDIIDFNAITANADTADVRAEAKHVPPQAPVLVQADKPKTESVEGNSTATTVQPEPDIAPPVSEGSETQVTSVPPLDEKSAQVELPNPFENKPVPQTISATAALKEFGEKLNSLDDGTLIHIIDDDGRFDSNPAVRASQNYVAGELNLGNTDKSHRAYLVAQAARVVGTNQDLKDRMLGMLDKSTAD